MALERLFGYERWPNDEWLISVMVFRCYMCGV